MVEKDTQTTSTTTTTQDDDEKVTITLIKNVIREMLDEHSEKLTQSLLAVIGGNFKITNERLIKAEEELQNLNLSVVEVRKEQDDIKISVETFEDIYEKKLNVIQDNIDKLTEQIKSLSVAKKNVYGESETHKQNSENFKKIEEKIRNIEYRTTTITKAEEYSNAERMKMQEKLRDMEDRNRRNNLRVDGIEELEGEDCEQLMTKLFEGQLGVMNVVIERAHRVGETKEDRERTIVLKLLNYKDKINILRNARKLKGSGIYINEDFSRQTMLIRRELRAEMRELREQGIYAVIKYDQLYVDRTRKKKE